MLLTAGLHIYRDTAYLRYEIIIPIDDIFPDKYSVADIGHWANVMGQGLFSKTVTIRNSLQVVTWIIVYYYIVHITIRDV